MDELFQGSMDNARKALDNAEAAWPLADDREFTKALALLAQAILHLSYVGGMRAVERALNKPHLSETRNGDEQ